MDQGGWTRVDGPGWMDHGGWTRVDGPGWTLGSSLEIDCPDIFKEARFALRSYALRCHDLPEATRRGGRPRGGAVQPTPLLPVVEPHPIVVHTGGATHPVAFARLYAPNLTVSADRVAPLRIDSWITGGYDNLHCISVCELRLV
jgi:hypothetical protein